MAKVGVMYPVYNKEGETSGKVMGAAITVTASPGSNDVKLYGDNKVKESDKSFVEGSAISVNTDHLPLDIYADLTGHTYTEADGLVANKDDVAPYVGFGFIGNTVKDNKAGWLAKYYPKVQFAEPSDENNTKSDTVAYATPTIEGSFYSDNNGEWKFEQEFATEAEAKTWLNGKAKIAVTP